MPALCRSGLLAAALLVPSTACTPPPSRAAAETQASEDQASEDPASAEATPATPATPAPPNPFVPGVTGDPALQAELDAARAAKGPDYAPRTEHLEADGRPTYTNRLIHETSPYLLQHAHNPVNWFAWGDEVFARAKAEDKPVLLSIGYSTCHWCHVMERESFEDPELAAYINAHFLAIKVDREQRPDLDEIYMRAVQLLSGRGGWPMTVLLTPAREPFFGGTYFPPHDRGRSPGFRTVLEQLEQAYRETPEAVVAQARKLSEAIAARSTPSAATELPGAELIAAAAASLAKTYDPIHGGFGEAPKFPRPVELELLLRYARRSGDEQALAQVRGTIDGIISGGVRDHLGGGFHRYSTDAAWLVPHFEKMLYDNAQLVVVLLELYQVSGEVRYAAVARETLDYLAREMSAQAGGFYSATDADSPNPLTGESDEGWFFTWTEAELDAALEPELAAAVRATYATTAAGNFEGRNIFHTPRPLAAVATELGIDVETLDEQLARARAILYPLRAKRPPPLRDDKVLSAWNGLAISAFARAAFVLDEPAYLTRAKAGADYLGAHHLDSQGRLLRSSLAGAPGGRGFLDDHAFVIQAYLDLFEASAEITWLERALALQASLDTHFLDTEHGAYFTTPADGETLLTRTKPSYDGAEPSGNSIAALNLLRLHQLTLEESYRARAVELLEALAATAKRGPVAVPMLLCALDFLVDRPVQVFVVAPPNEAIPPELLAPLRHSFVPNRAFVAVSEEQVPIIQGLVPALGLKHPLRGQATAYVCEDNVCQKPTSDPALFAKQLAHVEGY